MPVTRDSAKIADVVGVVVAPATELAIAGRKITDIGREITRRCGQSKFRLLINRSDTLS